jgi:hypothetical protein
MPIRYADSIEACCCIVCLVLLFISGCAKLPPSLPNNPNTNYQGYNELSSVSELLADEIGKLPEIQDGISDNEKRAVDYLLDYSSEQPKKTSNALHNMNKTGNSKIRRYCTPLQAAFWLIEDERYDDFNRIMQDYDLEGLLDLSWNLDFLDLSKSEIDQIISSLPEDLHEIYIRIDYGKKKDLTQKIIFEHFKSNKLPRSAERIVESAISNSNNKKRWDNFDDAVERLNSPELVNYFEGRFFIPAGGRGKTFVLVLTNKDLYRNKVGDPSNYARFAVLCLVRAGYDAKAIRVYPDHSVCTFKDLDGKEYILDQSTQACSYGKGILDKQLYLRNRPQVR